MRTLFTTKNDLLPLLKLAIPLALTGLVQSSVWFFETLFLSHLGPDILAAGSLVSWLFGTVSVMLFGTLSSINILVSHKYGAKDFDAISMILRDGILLSFLLVLPTILLFWNMAPIFTLFGQQQSVVPLAQSYLHSLVWGLLPNFIMVAILQFIIGTGQTRVSMYFSFVTVALNIFASYALIFGKFGFPQCGIAGAGWGLTVSYCGTALLLMGYLLINKNYSKYLRNIFNLRPTVYLKELLLIGLPMGMMYFLEVGFFLVLSLVIGSSGASMLAANQIALQYQGLLMSMMFAFAQAISVRTGQLLGAKEYASAQKVNGVGIVLAVFMMLIVAIIYWLMPSMLISLDFDVHNPSNIELVQFAKTFLAICAIYQIFEAVRISIFGSLRALKDTRYTLLVSIISFWGFGIGVGYLFSHNLSLSSAGFWWAMLLGAIVSVFLMYFRFESRMKLILADKNL